MGENRMKELRKERGLTQGQVAEALKIPKSTYAGYESGKREPTTDCLIKIADYFAVSLDYMLMHDNIEEPFHIKYQALDEDGKKVVDSMKETLENMEKTAVNVLNIEYLRCISTSRSEIVPKYTIRKASRSKNDNPICSEQMTKKELEAIKNLEDMDDNM